MNDAWRPSASLNTLRARARLLALIRHFFACRGVLEVDTPILSAHATVDRHIESFAVAVPIPDSRFPIPSLWFHTSPEFAMKRLLAAGSGPIYQLCHVFRAEESGRWHNPEFLMLEWYRPGWDQHRLMEEVESLLASCLSVANPPQPPFDKGGEDRRWLERPPLGKEPVPSLSKGGTGGIFCERLTYRDAFLRHAGFNPFDAPLSRLRECPSAPASVSAEEMEDRDFWLDLWLSMAILPRLGQERACLIYDFPASQAALARIRGEVAERFELVWKGVELANGFHELTDAAEQRRRFESDQAWRRARGRTVPPYDAHLVAALERGLPESAGVALGVDRLLMLLLNLPDIAQTMPFAGDRA